MIQALLLGGRQGSCHHQRVSLLCVCHGNHYGRPPTRALEPQGSAIARGCRQITSREGCSAGRRDRLGENTCSAERNGTGRLPPVVPIFSVFSACAGRRSTLWRSASPMGDGCELGNVVGHPAPPPQREPGPSEHHPS